ncbi:MAG: zinc ribbon domain-containing protein [Ktedonobacteraceae bacterium]|nr:zinc ribbon domain-containing protein [Ktedonobacteraceae bacterium]
MQRCEFCGSNIPDGASFCGHCGHTPRNAAESLTSAGGFSTIGLDEQETRPTVDTFQGQAPMQAQLGQDHHTILMQDNAATGDDEQDEDEEERRRRAALLGLAFPLATGMQPGAANVPMVQGMPQIGHVPSVAGTPGPGLGPGQMGTSGAPPWHYDAPTSPAPPHYAPPLHPHPPHGPGTSPGTTSTGPSGCLVALIVGLITIVILVSSIAAISFTVLAPALSTLSGATDVLPGGVLPLHGDHFLPGSSASLVLDGSQPLEFIDTSSSTRFAYAGSTAGLALDATSSIRAPMAGTTVTVKNDGSFDVKIRINSSWSLGQHTIRATEKVTPRSAVLTFTIHEPGTLPTATPAGDATPTATDTPASATATPTATSGTQTALSCVNPNAITLGPVSEGYTQLATKTITLCASGTGTVKWVATWNASQAPWLQLSNTSGQIQAPSQQQISVSAAASTLKAGNYSATVTFNDSQGDPAINLSVTFTVQAGCITATPNTLNFTMTTGGNAPPAQTVIASNCGALGNWSASMQLQTTTQWLSLNPGSGILNSRATRSVSVVPTSIATGLKPGTYTGKLLFVSGSSLATVSVTLNVRPAPVLILETPQPPVFNGCPSDPTGSGWICYASLNSSQNNQTSLTWTASSTGVPNITFSPASDTMKPGQTDRVKIFVPKNNCQIPTTLSFKGPGNTITITWSCGQVIG